MDKDILNVNETVLLLNKSVSDVQEFFQYKLLEYTHHYRAVLLDWKVCE